MTCALPLPIESPQNNGIDFAIHDTLEDENEPRCVILDISLDADDDRLFRHLENPEIAEMLLGREKARRIKLRMVCGRSKPLRPKKVRSKMKWDLQGMTTFSTIDCRNDVILHFKS